MRIFDHFIWSLYGNNIYISGVTAGVNNARHEGVERVIKVGGKGKGRPQFKGIEVTQKHVFVDSLQWNDTQSPLLLLGMY